MAARILPFRSYKRIKQTRKHFWIRRVLQFPTLAPLDPTIPTPDYCPGHPTHCIHERPGYPDITRCCHCLSWFLSPDMIEYAKANGKLPGDDLSTHLDARTARYLGKNQKEECTGGRHCWHAYADKPGIIECCWCGEEEYGGPI